MVLEVQRSGVVVGGSRAITELVRSSRRQHEDGQVRDSSICEKSDVIMEKQWG